MSFVRGDIREEGLSINEPLLPGPRGSRRWQQQQQQQQLPNSYAAPISLPKDGGMPRMKTVQSTPDLIESLDYEIIESGLYRDALVKRTPSEQFLYYCLRWVFALLIGVTTGLIAFFINLSVENIAGHKFMRTTRFIDTHGPWIAWLFYTSINVGLIFVAAYLCAFIGPAAGGSGIPEVKAYLNGIDTPHIMSMKTFAVKVLGSIGSVAGGLAVGKEGPLVHTGACVASILGQGGSRKYHLTWKWLRLFKNDRDRRDLVSCGAAAGVAAAFRAPVGGVLFALEEAASWWRSTLLWRAFFTTAVVAVVVREAMEWCESDHCGVFGGGGFIIFDISGSYVNFGLKELLPVVVIGMTGGFLGTIFNAVNEKISIWRRDKLGKDFPWVRVAEACMVAFATSVVSFWVPWFGPCKVCPENANFICPSQEHIGNFKQFHCPDGHYSDLAGLLFSTFDDAIRNLFKVQSHSDFSFHALFMFNVCFFFLAVVTYGTMVPSGLFVPAILNGASYGRAVGMLMGRYFGSESQIDEGTYAVLGAASFLGGSMRMTVSLCIILLELTGQTKILPLIMLVLLMSKTIGDNFTEAIYDIHLRLKRIPFLEARPEQFMRYLRAKDCITTKLVSLNAIEKVGTIYETLAMSPYNSFPVHEMRPDGQSIFHGLVLRNHLLVLLKSKKSFQDSSQCEPDRHKRAMSSHTLIDFGKPGTGRGMTLDQITLDDAEMNMYIDLHLFVNSSPYTVSENMMLSKVYTLFRQLGLRHLCVVPKPSKIVGVITRKDLLPEVFEERNPNLKHLGRKETFVS